MIEEATSAADDDYWQAQEAKARFSEVMRRAREVGPQHITVHGREAAVVLSADEYRKLRGSGPTGADIVAAFQACPFPDDLILEHERIYPRVRDVEL